MVSPSLYADCFYLLRRHTYVNVAAAMSTLADGAVVPNYCHMAIVVGSRGGIGAVLQYKPRKIGDVIEGSHRHAVFIQEVDIIRPFNCYSTAVATVEIFQSRQCPSAPR